MPTEEKKAPILFLGTLAWAPSAPSCRVLSSINVNRETPAFDLVITWPRTEFSKQNVRSEEEKKTTAN